MLRRKHDCSDWTNQSQLWILTVFLLVMPTTMFLQTFVYSALTSASQQLQFLSWVCVSLHLQVYSFVYCSIYSFTEQTDRKSCHFQAYSCNAHNGPSGKRWELYKHLHVSGRNPVLEALTTASQAWQETAVRSQAALLWSSLPLALHFHYRAFHSKVVMPVPREIQT